MIFLCGYVVLRIGFVSLLNNDDKKCNKNYKLISCLGTGWENKN